MIPKCTMLIPNPIATGRSNGGKITRAAAVSRNIPKNNINRSTIIINTTLFVAIPASAAAAFCGILSHTIYLENKLAEERINNTPAVLLTDSTIMGLICLIFNLR